MSWNPDDLPPTAPPATGFPIERPGDIGDLPIPPPGTPNTSGPWPFTGPLDSGPPRPLPESPPGGVVDPGRGPGEDIGALPDGLPGSPPWDPTEQPELPPRIGPPDSPIFVPELPGDLVAPPGTFDTGPITAGAYYPPTLFGIVEGERSFPSAPHRESELERLMKGVYRPTDRIEREGLEEFERLMRGTRTPRLPRVESDFERLMRGTVPRLPRVPLPGPVLGEMYEILREAQRRAKQQREGIRVRPPLPEPLGDEIARVPAPLPSPPEPIPLPPPAPPPSVPRTPPETGPAPPRVPTPLPRPAPAPMPRIPAPRSTPWWQRIAPFFFGRPLWNRSNTPRSLDWPSTLLQPSATPEPMPLPGPSAGPSPLPTPAPSPPSVPLPPDSSVSTNRPSSNSPLTALKTQTLQWRSECECPKPTKRRKPKRPSKVIADVTVYRRRMSQNSLDNLRRGNHR